VAVWNSLNAQIESCAACPRLREHCQQIAETKRRAFRDEDYWGKPVPNFGDSRADLLIVGLAPAAHGANRTGRMFTGDRSGEWLYRALHKAGFANQPDSRRRDDGLQLTNCCITAICHCAPPGNKPSREEIAHCQPWLSATLDSVPARVMLALGQLAWNQLLKLCQQRQWHVGAKPRFAHRAIAELAGDRWLLGSFHPSQQNTFTGRLTEPMFDAVFRDARKLLSGE
jgi:uracil-DNA glycosylase family 4